MSATHKNNGPNSEREAQIRAQATSIMDNFFTALKHANVSSDKIGVKRIAQTRIPKSKEMPDGFRSAMFKNAPSKDTAEDYIIAEKKTW